MSESLFTTHRYEIPFSKYNEPIYLIPVGDIHRHAPLCDVARWLEFLRWAKSKPRAYFLGMGDYDDMASESERRTLYHHTLHESTAKTIENMQRRFVSAMAHEMSFMKGRVIGLLEGNHYAKFPNGTTSTQLMCTALDTTYLGYSSFIRLVFVDQSKGKRRAAIDIWAHHGQGGGGKLLGGSVNSVQHMAEIAEADIYLSGHDHKKWAALKSKLTLTDGGRGVIRLKHKKILLGRTGSFLKGYEPGEESYVARAGMSPTDLGVIKIELTPKRIQTSTGKGNPREDRFHVDIHASI